MGSVNTAVGSTSPEAIFGSHLRFCSSVPPPRMSSAAISVVMIMDKSRRMQRLMKLGNDAHRFLAQAHPAVFLRNGEAEHPELRHVGDDFERDIAVRKMPAVGVGHDLALGEFSHFLADRFERVVETVIQHQRTAAPHQLDEARAVLRIVAAGDPTLDSGRHPRGDLRAPQAEIGGPDDLALADRDAADGLREVFADTHADRQRFELAQSPGRGNRRIVATPFSSATSS